MLYIIYIFHIIYIFFIYIIFKYTNKIKKRKLADSVISEMSILADLEESGKAVLSLKTKHS